MKNILVVGDSHADPDVSNERFEWLGNFILVNKPDVVVQIGDFGTFGSLSHFDRGKKKAEGKRYKNDIESVIDAQERMFKPLREYNKSKKKQYMPELYLTLGNHEDRIARAANEDPRLYGTLTVDDCRFEQYGWKVIPFKHILNIEDIHFTHYFTNSNNDKAIGGVNVGRSIVLKHMISGVMGHNHLYSHYNEARADGKMVHGLSVGCYFEHEEDWLSPRSQMSWWRGLMMLKNASQGDFDLEAIRMSTIKEQYS